VGQLEPIERVIEADFVVVAAKQLDSQLAQQAVHYLIELLATRELTEFVKQ